MQTYKPNYGAWEAHFKAMANGNTKRKGGRTIVSQSSAPQSGSGIQMVTPTKQVVEMAKARKNKATKGRKKRSKRHSASSSRRGNISKKPKRAKKTPRSKTIKRRRKNKNG